MPDLGPPRGNRARSATWLLALLAIVPSAAPAAFAATRGSPNPVLIVGGTSSPEFALATLACRLRKDGFTVFTMALGGRGFGDIAVSARSVAERVDAIRAETGAAKVDLIGHSQGGLESRYYLKFLGGGDGVGTYVSLGTPQYGSGLANLGRLISRCLRLVALQQMAIGSPFLADLNAGDDTPGAARYVSIYTALDALVQPFGKARLADDAINVDVLSHCPLRFVGHLGLLLDGAVYGLVRSALQGGALSTSCVAF
jgi:triacylglycerol esterase/lipase EstA (alpha/beta hydrolase family)